VLSSPVALRTMTRGWVIVLILLLSFPLRLYRLAEKEMWYDEAFAVLYAEKEPVSIIYGTVTPVEGAAADIHPLLYYLFLHGWMRIGQSPLVVRFPSVVIGVLAIALLARLGRGLFEPKVGLLAAVLAPIFSRREWFDVLVVFFSVLSHGLCFDRLPRWRVE